MNATNTTKAMNVTNATKAILLCAMMAACATTAAETDEKAAALPTKEPMVPPVWIVADTGTVARAEAGDADAMRTIADGYVELAASTGIQSDDDERYGMLLESVKWMQRRAGIIVKNSEILSRAEAGDADAMKEVAEAYLYLATARGAEASGEARKELFGNAMKWMRRRAETLASAGDADAMVAVSKGYAELLQRPDFLLDRDEMETVMEECMQWVHRRARVMADREGDLESVRKRAEAGDPAAQRNLGFRYSLGVDVEKDEKLAFEWTKKAAEQGDARAMLNLANDYAHGRGCTADAKESLAWYRKAATGFRELAIKGEKLDLRPLVLTGQKLLKDEPPSAIRDSALGAKFLEIAARCGDAEGMRLFGEQFAIGKAVEEDFDTALLWLRRADRRGDEEALGIIRQIHDIASRRLFQKVSEKADAGDPESKALVEEFAKLLKKSALGDELAMTQASAIIGYAPMQAELGRNYMMGTMVAQDKRKAVEWLKKAADQGECRAQFWLGLAYELGDGIEKDDCRALTLWQRSRATNWDDAIDKLVGLQDEFGKSAEAGNPSAQFFLGAAFENGYGVERDFEKAVGWYRKAAEQGHPGAQAFLGWALLNGQGVETNAAEAVAWFRKAAEQGNSEAQLNYGLCLFYGDGVEKDECAAAVWYRKAAEQGEMSAMYNLGLCFLDGTGVKRDSDEAVKWFRKAADLGHAGSLKILKRMNP